MFFILFRFIFFLQKGTKKAGDYSNLISKHHLHALIIKNIIKPPIKRTVAEKPITIIASPTNRLAKNVKTRITEYTTTYATNVPTTTSKIFLTILKSSLIKSLINAIIGNTNIEFIQFLKVNPLSNTSNKKDIAHTM